MIAIAADHISLSFGTKKILENITFSLNEGDRLGSVGVNGCGKSTLFRILLGETEPDSGEVYLSKGKTVGILRQNDAFAEFQGEYGEANALEVMYRSYPELLEQEERLAALEKMLHTGDLGKMDEDGFVYFSQRIKRMIITSGYNVYPGQLENIIDGHEKVLLSCVIGVKDPYKMQKVKAFVVLRPGCEPSDAVKQEILDYCRQHIAKYAMPYDIECRPELPKTLVGKVAYRVLEEEEAERQAAEDAKNP